MKFHNLYIPDVFLLEPNIFEDNRGSFFESFNLKGFCKAINRNVTFVQDNHSLSKKNVLRGLHYQDSPKEQGKLIRVISGSIYDVAVDIRKNSETFGKWVAVELSAENKKQLWIPEGFAHGFLTLTENTEVLYKTTDYYEPSLERSIKWDDRTLNIDWPIAKPILSIKDQNAKQFIKINK